MIKNEVYGDASNCMVKLVVLGNSHKQKGRVFELESDKGGRLETLNWSNYLSSSIISKHDDCF